MNGESLHEGAAQVAASSDDVLDILLETIRRKLGMEVAYLSEFIGNKVVFRAASVSDQMFMARLGQTMDIREVYCKHIIDGNLPRLIEDTSNHSIAMALPITQVLPIGSHVSVPVYRQDGEVFGMLCCLSRTPNPALSSRDLLIMEKFAQFVEAHMRSDAEQGSLT